MEGVQNLCKAVYDFKLKVEATEEGSVKHKVLMHQAINYLYRCKFPLRIRTCIMLTCAQTAPLSCSQTSCLRQRNRASRPTRSTSLSGYSSVARSATCSAARL